MRAAIYVRVSSDAQTVDNQLLELRSYLAARQWTIAGEYRDEGICGAKDRRPALDRLVKDARRRKFDVVVTWKLDRLGRNLKHLITLLDELQTLGVAFVSLGEGIDATTPAGKLQMHILGAIAEFERGRIVERVRAVLAGAKAQQPVVKARSRTPICATGLLTIAVGDSVVREIESSRSRS
jgi:DNA invertase Pin-like site-specific DNA recombinase